MRTCRFHRRIERRTTWTGKVFCHIVHRVGGRRESPHTAEQYEKMRGSMNASRLNKPAALAGLVDYQANSVVSQTLVKARTGTVTVFAFDTGEGLSEHAAPFDALLLVVEGRATVRVGSEDHAMSGGDIVLLPAGIPHAVHAVDRFKMLLIMIRDSGSHG